jgi:hypothetical protein
MREQLYHSKELFFVFRMFLKVATFRSGFSTSQLTYYMSYHHAFDLCRVLICEFPEVVCMGGGQWTMPPDRKLGIVEQIQKPQ